MGALAALLGLALYANTLGHQYVYDDTAVIPENRFVTGGLRAETIQLIFTTEYRRGHSPAAGSLYRPIPLLMFTAEWQLAPNAPFLGHAVNVLLYALTGWVLWLVLSRVFAGRPPALVAAAVLLFMAHPVHTEVVANIKSRDEILALLFGLGALYATWRHAQEGGSRWLAWAVLWYSLALFSKESAITLLAAIPLTIWFFQGWRTGPILRVSAALLVPAVAYMVIRKRILDAQPYHDPYSGADSLYVLAGDRLERLTTALMMCGRYVKTLVFPDPLVCDMGYPQVQPADFGDWQTWAGATVMLGILAVGLAGLRARRTTAYAALFFLFTFSLFSNLVYIIGTSYGERLLYVPSLGFALMLSWALGRVAGLKDGAPPRNAKGGGYRFWGLVCGVLLLYGSQTISRNADWYDEDTLFQADLPKSPRSVTLNYNVGLVLFDRSKDEVGGPIRDTVMVLQALTLFTNALELTSHPMIHAARGTAWFDLGQEDMAMADWEVALRDPLIHAMTPGGTAWSDLGKEGRAMAANWAVTLRNIPMLVRAQNGFGYLLIKQGRLVEGERHLRLAVEFDPFYVEAYRNLGVVLAQQARYLEAIGTWEKGLDLEPSDLGMAHLMSMAYNELGDTAQADLWRSKTDEIIKSGVGGRSKP